MAPPCPEQGALMTLVSLSQIFSAARSSGQRVCHAGEQYIEYQTLRHRVAALSVAYSTQAGKRWLLAEPSPLEFLVRLFALLHAGKEVVVPPNFQAGTITSMQPAFTDNASTVSPASDAPLLQPLDSEQCHIHLYTSGTTGNPKIISKTLAQFEREIAILEQLWGKQLSNTSVIASVPHHHIYGLLFRLLWPLASGRIFDCMTDTLPDHVLQRSALLGNCTLVSSPALLSRLPELMPLHALSPQVRLVFSSGGPLNHAIAERYVNEYGQAPVEILGSTETGGIAWRQQDQDAAWTGFPGMEIAQDQDGAMLLRSPILANTVPIRLEDAIIIAPDQRFTLQGRLDRIVKLEEKRLSLPAMERMLDSHPWVHQSAAIVVQHQRQTIGAVIVLDPAYQHEWQAYGKSGLVNQLRQYLAQHYDTVLLPRYWRFVNALPLNERGKLSLDAITHLFEEQVTHDTPA